MVQYKNIPKPTDNRNQSQVDIQDNFKYLIDTSGSPPYPGMLPVDHKASADNVANPTDGFHKQISMNQSTLPITMTNAVNGQNSEGIWYTKANSINTFSEAHFVTSVGVNSATPYIDYPLNLIQSFARCDANGTIIGRFFNTATVAVGTSGTNTLYTVIFQVNMPNANYVAYVTGEGTLGTGGDFYIQQNSYLVNGFTIIRRNTNATPLGFTFQVLGLF